MTGLSSAFTSQVTSLFAGNIRTSLPVIAAGGASSIMFTLLPVFIIEVLGETHSWIGGYFTAVTFTSIPVTLLLGRLADRIAHKRALGLCTATWIVLGCVLVVSVQSIGQLVIVGIVFLSLFEALNAQIFAIGRSAAASEAEEIAVTTSMRTAYALGYVVGPMIGALLTATLGIRLALVSCAVLFGLAALTFCVKRVSVSRADDEDTVAVRGDAPGQHAGFALAALCLTLTTPIVRSAFLVVLATSVLDIPLDRVLLILAVAPLAELFLIPLCGSLALRWGPDRVVLLGCAAAVFEMGCLALVTSLWQIALLQLVGAFVVAAVMSVGMAMVQGLFSGRPAFGTSAFLATRSVSSLMGNLGGGVLAGAHGLRWVFAGAAALALIGTTVMSMRLMPRRPRTAYTESSPHHESGTRHVSG
ncbi:MFS transporter [Streptomyces sp. NPDC057638]|uniref:MFS transporter n=1 Tax=Streptomyces sp. NPDC057638 TaxID=3346190 RepID=UPI0036CBA69C